MEAEKKDRTLQKVCYRAGNETEGFAMENRKENEDGQPDSQGNVARSSQVESASMYLWLTQNNGNGLQWEAELGRRKEESWVCLEIWLHSQGIMFLQNSNRKNAQGFKQTSMFTFIK